MTAIWAHVVLAGRHRRTAVVSGLHWRYCGHRSHRLRLPCWRWFVHDGYCSRHNSTCWGSCPAEGPDPVTALLLFDAIDTA